MKFFRLFGVLAHLACITVEAEDLPKLQIMQTKTGVHFGLFQQKPAAPAPTLFIFAAGIEAAGADPQRTYTAAGAELAKDGWIYVVLDPPCHGFDQQPGEPGALAGWAHRLKAGQDLMGPFVQGCREVLDQLIAEGYTDANRVAASGTSRGGFCALHFASGDPRIQVVTTISPVTNPLALSEFQGVTQEQAQPVNIDSYVDGLVGRTVWLTIGNDDPRVNTDDCITLARKLVTATRRLKPDLKRVPVELIVGPSLGHRAIDNVYTLEADFLRKQFSTGK